KGFEGNEIGIYGRMAGIVDTFAALTNHRPYAAAASSYEALRSISGWAGDFFHEPLVQQFVSSIGVFPVGSLIELSTGEVAIVVAHDKVRRLKPPVLIVELRRVDRLQALLRGPSPATTMSLVIDRLRKALREEDRMAAINDEEVCVVLPRLAHPSLAVLAAVKVLRVLDRPMAHEG